MEEFIIGNVRRVIYESTQSSYKVGIFKIREVSNEKLEEFLNSSISFVGNFTNLNTELNYKFYGQFSEHPKYGLQFNVTQYEMINPTSTNEIISYLSSGLFRGIGPKLAKKIVDKLGVNVLENIRSSALVLSKVEGISSKKSKEIHDKMNSLSEDDILIMELTKLGFSINDSLKIIKNYKLNIQDILKTNIYILTNIINFDKVDNIYLKYNDILSDLRIENVLMHSIKTLCYKSGNTLILEEEVYLETIKYFNSSLTIERFNNILEILLEQNKIHRFNNYLMLNYFYETELFICEKIKFYNKISIKGNPKKVDKHIKSYELNNKIVLNKEQKNAIKMSILNNLVIISGGPGTGKTTIIKAIVEYYENKEDIALLAPTGRSAKRMAESVNLKSSTIHKFLKWNKEEESFGLNENNKSKCKIIIIDEFSMVDIFLFSSLLKAFEDTVKLVLVGDANQLPSINPGNILSDLLSCEYLKSQFLVDIYRTNEKSYINILANKIKNKERIEQVECQDYKFINCEDESIIKYLKIVCEKIKRKKLSLDEFQVLIPMYKGINGIDNLNRNMQEIFNPQSEQSPQVEYLGTIFRENDKVIQLVNDVDNNIYNGDIGYVEKINLFPKKSLVINFSGINVIYESEDFDKINLAYAISIHKSQGSEYDNVVVILASSHKRMFYNKLVYTACTRAKKSLVVIGKNENFNYAITSNYSLKRVTYLKNLLEV